MEQNGVKMPVEVRGVSIENTFIIPVIFNYKGVDKCIETIYNYNENFRIYLIDQTEGGKCAYLQDRVHLYIKTCRNLGFAKAMNTGIVIAMRESEYITLCNDDVEFVHKDWFPNVKEYFEKRPEILGINPASIKAFTDDRTKDWMPYKEKYTEDDIKYLFEPKAGTDCEFTYHPTWFFEGAMMFCTVFPSKAFDIVGLLDEGFFPGCFLKGTRILTSFKPTYKNIEDIEIGDKVITHLGRLRKVKNVFRRQYKGIINHIHIEEKTVSLTPEHEVFYMPETITSDMKIPFKKEFSQLYYGDKLIIPYAENKFNLYPSIDNCACEWYEGEVYDFEVDEDHSYIAEKIAVGNSSEDYDWCRRCYALGYRMGHFNGAWLYHHWLTSKGQYDWNSGEKEKYRAYPAFPDKWKSDEEPEPDIYGKKGKMDKPTLVVPL